MTSDTKSLLKKTILGLITGGTVSAIYAHNRTRADEAEEEAYQEGTGKNQIVVPLSRKHYLKALEANKPQKAEKKPKADVSQMAPLDLAALKRSLLKAHSPQKYAEAPTQIKEKTTSASSTAPFKGKTAQIRDPKGRYSTDAKLGKAAEGYVEKFWRGSKGELYDALGFTGGAVAGLYAAKAIADRIAINRKKQAVERSRRTYANLINKEVNDEDEPLYRKEAQDRGAPEKFTGSAMFAGVGAAALSGLLAYKIVENRRKKMESEADKDSARFPKEKTIKFKFV